MDAVFEDVFCPLLKALPKQTIPPLGLLARERKQKLVSEGTANRTERKHPRLKRRGFRIGGVT